MFEFLQQYLKLHKFATIICICKFTEINYFRHKSLSKVHAVFSKIGTVDLSKPYTLPVLYIAKNGKLHKFATCNSNLEIKLL